MKVRVFVTMIYCSQLFHTVTHSFNY